MIIPLPGQDGRSEADRFPARQRAGEAPAWKLFELVKVHRKEGVTAPRNIDDYTIEVRRTRSRGQ